MLLLCVKYINSLTYINTDINTLYIYIYLFILYRIYEMNNSNKMKNIDDHKNCYYFIIILIH